MNFTNISENVVTLEYASSIIWNAPAPSFIAGCVMLAAYAMIVSKHKKKQVPYAKASMIKCLRDFSGKDSPWFMLRLACEVQQLGRTCYRLTLPLSGGVYIVCNAELQHQILKDSTTDKSPSVLVLLF
jgi:hypothetical protein